MQTFLAREVPGPSEFSAGTGPVTCPKPRGTSRADAFSFPGPGKNFRSLRSRKYTCQKGILAHRHTGLPKKKIFYIPASILSNSPSDIFLALNSSLSSATSGETDYSTTVSNASNSTGSVFCYRILGTDVSHLLALRRSPGTCFTVPGKMALFPNFARESRRDVEAC
jgi:hypothetical protein